ncbi:MAG: 50S ribosomal protein L24 [candidate division Zixibacteria bacterium DG_27]|nr:MAG: 50S ribosomal protein L24 [candidate division Zixibacteria bacterium DG_27]
MRIKKNDTVMVIAGKGRTQKSNIARVLKVFPEERRILVEGINMVKRHSRPTRRNPKGGVVEKEGSIHISNVMLYCNKCSSATRVGYRILEDGTKVRICKKCGEIL